jgi:Skp family chaperone for outer membrane proteins
MRYRVSILIMLCSLLVGSGWALAQDPSATASSPKIGIINIQQAIASTAEGKQALGEIDKKYAPKRADLQRLQQQITDLQDQLQRQGATLSDEERVRISRDLDDKQRGFKRSQEDAQSDFQQDNQDAVNRIGQKMVKVINDYAQKNGLILVIDDAQVPIYYAAQGTDITEPIVKLYDAQYPAKADASAGGAATKPSAPASKPSAPASKPPAKPNR